MPDNLIFLHGWGTSPSVWKHQLDYFSAKYNVSAPILASSLTIECEASRRDHRPLTIDPRLSTILIGWSYGGMLAIELAAQYPSKFSGLVLVGSSAKFSSGMNPVIIKNLLRNLKRDFETTMKNCYRTFFSKEEFGFIDGFMQDEALPDKKFTIDLLAKLAQLDLKGILKAISVPALIIHGDQDQICPCEAGAFLNKNIKCSRLEIIKGAGHMPFYTNPAKFNAILEEFIEDGR
ncbi:MAG: alpha/beta hydrolase [Candidatus Omnitrophica bacterium]|nr:alpha/beta hydrolase [Candidatus Omnitrophota bacterium]